MVSQNILEVYRWNKVVILFVIYCDTYENILETMRLHSVVPLLKRVCVADYKVPDSDLTIEKGTDVFIPIKGLHYDSKYYPNPTVFDPERFSSEEREKIHPYTHLPFGGGPRLCIGKTMFLIFF